MRGLPHEGKGLLQALRGLSRGEALREQPREAKGLLRGYGADGLQQRLKFMGEKLQNLEPREVKCALRGPPREAKPYTRAKWEIRFQRFALSFRPSVKVLVGSPPREAEGLLRGYAARGNEKFHLPPACHCVPCQSSMRCRPHPGA